MAQTHKPRRPRKIRGARRAKPPVAPRAAHDPGLDNLADEIRKYLAETSKNPLRDAVKLRKVITKAMVSEPRAKVSRRGEIRKYPAETIEIPLKEAAAHQEIMPETMVSENLAKVSRGGESRLPSKEERLASEPAASGRETAKDAPPTDSISERAAGRRPRSAELDELLESVLERPEEWLDAPNPRFHGVRPADMVGTADEAKIVDILRAVDQGLF